MPPKKEKVVLTEEQVDTMILRATLREKALKESCARRDAEVKASREEEAELLESFRLLDDALFEAKGERYDVVSDFLRQHKATEDELIARCTVLDNAIADLKDQHELSRLALAETKKERDHYIQMKEVEFEEQEKKMKEMEEEFRVMLTETQTRMTERVENTMRVADDEEEDEPVDEQ